MSCRPMPLHGLLALQSNLTATRDADDPRMSAYLTSLIFTAERCHRVRSRNPSELHIYRRTQVSALGTMHAKPDDGGIHGPWLGQYVVLVDDDGVAHASIRACSNTTPRTNAPSAAARAHVLIRSPFAVPASWLAFPTRLPMLRGRASRTVSKEEGELHAALLA